MLKTALRTKMMIPGFIALFALTSFAVNPPDSLNIDVGDLDGDGTNDTLVLTKHSLRGAGFMVKTYTVAGGIVEHPLPPVRTYRGYVQSNPNMRVRATLSVDGTTLSAALADGRAHIYKVEAQPISYTEPEGTFDPGTPNVEIPVVANRTSPTPLGDTVPIYNMRQIYLGCVLEWRWFDAQGIPKTSAGYDQAIAATEARVNDLEEYYARDIGESMLMTGILIMLEDHPDGDVADDTKNGHKEAWNEEMEPIISNHADSVFRCWQNSGGFTGGGVLDPDNPLKTAWQTVGGISYVAGVLGHEMGHNHSCGHSKSWQGNMEANNSCIGSGNIERACDVLNTRTTVPGAAITNAEQVIYGTPLHPHAREDARSTWKETPIEINVLDNDYDGNGDDISVTAVGVYDVDGVRIPATAVGVEAPTKRGGTAKILANGNVLYTPPDHWVGVDNFAYALTDAGGLSNVRGYVKVYVKNQGLASRYTFEETSGYGVHDLGPNQAHGNVLNGNLGAAVPGLVGEGVAENSDIDSVEGGESIDGDMSVSLWVKYSSIPSEGGALLKKRRIRKDTETDISAGWQMGHMQANGFNFKGQLQPAMGGDDFDVTSSAPIVPGTWYHLVMTIDRTSQKIRGWVNNVEMTGTSSTTTIPDGVLSKSHTPLQIMHNGNGAYVMDDLRIYNNALTPTEIAALYAAAGTEDLPAGAPYPWNGATNAVTDQILSWIPGQPDKYHYEVYVGTDYNSVLNATLASPECRGRQELTEYTESFAADTQYYWRIDEIVGETTVAGDVWGFHTGGDALSIANASFESSTVNPNYYFPNVPSWNSDASTVWEGAPDVPNTPYGDNWAQPQAKLYQRVGRWTPDVAYKIGMLLGTGTSNANPFEGVEVRLFIGDDKEYLTENMSVSSYEFFARELAVGTLAPSITSGQTNETEITLDVGNLGVAGDVLWLEITALGAEPVYVDNVTVTAVDSVEVEAEVTHNFVSDDFVVQPDGITATNTMGSVTATVVASDTNAGTVTIIQRLDFLGVLNDTIDETNGNATQTKRIGTPQMLSLSFNTRVRIDGIAFNNLLGTTTGREITVVSSPALSGLNYDLISEDFTSQTAKIETFGFAGTTFNIQHTTAAGNVEPEILFGVDGYDSIVLEAGEILTFACDTTDSNPTQGGWGLDSFTVTTVDNDSTPPIFTVDPIDGGDATEDVGYTGTIAGSATPANVGDTLTYSKIAGPAWLNVATDGALSGTNSIGGLNEFTVQADDGNGGTDIAGFYISVINVNDDPIFTLDPIDGGSGTEAVPYSNTIAGSATDEEGDTLTYSKSAGPAWLDVATNGVLSGTPPAGYLGTNTFTVQVADGNGGSDSAALNIEILAVSLISVNFSTGLAGNTLDGTESSGVVPATDWKNVDSSYTNTTTLSGTVIELTLSKEIKADASGYTDLATAGMRHPLGSPSTYATIANMTAYLAAVNASSYDLYVYYRSAKTGDHTVDLGLGQLDPVPSFTNYDAAPSGDTGPFVEAGNPDSNYIKYTGLTADTITMFVDRGDKDSLFIGFQIKTEGVPSGTDIDADTLNDGWEIGQYGSIGVYSDTDNPDGDRLNMFAEMAFGGEALVDDSLNDFVTGSITNHAGSNSVAFSYRRAKEYLLFNINYQLQTAAMLETNVWTNSVSVPESIIDDPDGTTEWVNHLLLIPEEEQQQFYRCIAFPQESP